MPPARSSGRSSIERASVIARPRKRDIKDFRKAAVAAKLTDVERFEYSASFHSGHRWEEDGEPDYSWFVEDMRQWKEECERER